MKQNIVAIVQARMGSTRLPAKVLAEISGQPMLWHVVNRLKSSHLLNLVVVATSTNENDDTIVKFCKENNINCLRGSENDVLDRYYGAAKEYHADVVVRVTADCPLIDPQVVDDVVRGYLETGHDYVTNTFRYTYPDGLDVEVFSFEALETAWKEACQLVEREHVTPYIRNSAKFKTSNVENKIDLSRRNLRWTVDETSDLEFVRAVYKNFENKKEIFSMLDVLELLEREPSLIALNNCLIRNEGHYISIAKEEPVLPMDRKLDRSFAMKARCENLIPSCTQTFSKGYNRYVQGVAPIFLERGEGAHVWDVDGNRYIDYPLALGPVILGHHYQKVDEAVKRQIDNGIAFSLPHPLEIELAEILTSIIPCAEMVRYGKNGSDATSGAVRAARAVTGRDVIACCGYHGWQDWFIGTTTRNKGVPKAVQKLTVPFEYNNIESLKKIFEDHRGKVAAVIMEPFGVAEPKNNFLYKIKELAQAEGAILIFDEVITGFRLALGGAQEYYGVTPDLSCFGKAMANGYPISTVVGRKDIMKVFDEIFFSFTFGGDALSLAASIATINEIREKNVIGHLWELGQMLKDGYNVLAKLFGMERFTECIGLPPRTVITFKDETGSESLLLFSLFQQECLKRGILFDGAQNLCYSHSHSDVDHTLRVYRTAMEIMAEAIKDGDPMKRLEGKPVEEIFRRA